MKDSIIKFLERVEKHSSDIYNDDDMLLEYFDRAISLLTKVVREYDNK